MLRFLMFMFAGTVCLFVLKYGSALLLLWWLMHR